MPLNIKLNDHPWMETNRSLSITSYLNPGGEKLVKLFNQMYTLHIKHPAGDRIKYRSTHVWMVSDGHHGISGH